MDTVLPAMGSRLRRGRGRFRRVAVATFAALTAVAGAAGAVGLTASPAHAGTTSRAAVVVEVDGVVHTAKITFASDSVSGLDALRSAGFTPLVRVFGGNGGAVCALKVGTATIGCPADGTCLNCAAPDYWSYWRALAGETKYTWSPMGAGNTQVRDGDVEAWVWDTGGAPTPFVSFADVWGPDPTTTTRPPATTAPTTPHASSTTTVTAAPLGGTPSTVTTTAPPTRGVTSTTTRGTTIAHATTTTRAGTGSTDTIAPSGSDATSPASVRRLATAPVVARGGGGSPYGLLTFAVILLALVGAIVLARRRRARPSRSPA